MSQLLQSQLENEKAILAKLKATKRDDCTVDYLLQRIEREIKHLERKIYEHKTAREKVIKFGYSRRLTRYVKKVISRYWTYIHGDNHTIPQIFTATTL